MRAKVWGLLAATAFAVAASGAVQAQDILIGNLAAGAGPFATLAKTNEIAAQMAIDEINKAGGVLGKQVELVIEDDQTTNPGIVLAFSKLLLARLQRHEGAKS